MLMLLLNRWQEESLAILQQRVPTNRVNFDIAVIRDVIALSVGLTSVEFESKSVV
jgi:hypothetical protein